MGAQLECFRTYELMFDEEVVFYFVFVVGDGIRLLCVCRGFGGVG